MRALEEAGSPKLWLPAIAVVAIVVVVPVMATIVLGFLVTNNGHAFLGLAAYRLLSRSPELASLGSILRRGLVVASISQLIALPVGFTLARCRSASLRVWFIGLMLAPFFCSDAIRAYCWSRILSADGLLFRTTSVVSSFFHIVSFRFSELAVVTALCSAVIPFGVIAVVASLPRGDEDLWTASWDLGVSRSWEFWNIGLPAAAPGFAIGWLFQFILASFSSVEEQYLGNSTSMQKIASSMINSDLETGSLSFFALSSFVLIVLVAMLLTCGWLIAARRRIASLLAGLVKAAVLVVMDIRALKRTDTVTGLRKSRTRRRSFGLFSLVCNVLTIGTYVLVLAPIVEAIVLAFRDGNGAGSAWTLQNFREAFEGGSILSALTRSLFMASFVGLVCALLAMLLSTALWKSMVWRGVILLVVVLGSLLPAETYALSLLHVVRAIGVETGGLALAAVGQMAWALPFSVGATLLAYRKLDTSLLEVAWDFGEGAWHILGRVIMRFTWPAILGSALFGFLLSLNEYSRGLYLGGGAEFLSTRVFGRMQSGLIGNGRQIFAVAGGLVATSFFLCSIGVLRVALSRKQTVER